MCASQLWSGYRIYSRRSASWILNRRMNPFFVLWLLCYSFACNKFLCSAFLKISFPFCSSVIPILLLDYYSQPHISSMNSSMSTKNQWCDHKSRAQFFLVFWVYADCEILKSRLMLIPTVENKTETCKQIEVYVHTLMSTTQYSGDIAR